MAYKKISDLTTASGYAAGDLIEMESAAGASVKSTFINAMLGNDGLDSSLEAGDAGKLSRWGWGVDTITVMTGSLDNYKTAGVFADPANLTNSAFPGVSIAIVTVKADTPSLVTQEAEAFSNTAANRRIVRRQYNTAIPGWSPWVEVFTAETDGNAGQPPGAKSNKTSNTTIGWFDSVDCASGAQVTLPSGGDFEWFVTTYGATYNSVKSGISAGGTITGTASANLTMYYKRRS